MRRITIKRARTWHYRKMRPRIEPSNDLALSSPFQSWLDCTTDTSGYDFRKGQDFYKVRSHVRHRTHEGKRVQCMFIAMISTMRSEVCGCDLVAIRGDEPPVVIIGELKLSFSLDLVLQAVDRTAACDEVWLAVGPGGRKRLNDSRVRKLCRFLGFGLLGVSSAGVVEVLVEPRPWKPRKDKKRRARLVDEHRKRIRDPAPGGTTRQDHDSLSSAGPCLRGISS
jgi:Putative PD-(D/E)XK phosphodiesterase (DUF2161)